MFLLKVLSLPNFKDFPSSAMTVEFWMWTGDHCNEGAPISYATEFSDNSFVLYNYKDW